MEVPGGHNNKLIVCAYEVFITAFLLIGINWSATAPGSLPLVIGVIQFAVIIWAGQISGSHINPAVTLGVLFREGFSNIPKNAPFALMIILSECIGACLGCVIVLLGTHRVQDKAFFSPDLAVLCPSNDRKGDTINNVEITNNVFCNNSQMYWPALWMEVVCTFFFVTLILNIKYVNGSKEIILNAMAIGLMLYSVASMVGQWSGGCFNPAVGIVQTLFQRISFNSVAVKVGNNEINGLDIHGMLSPSMFAIYVLGPALGGILAGCFQLFNQMVLDKMKEAAEAERENYNSNEQKLMD